MAGKRRYLESGAAAVVAASVAGVGAYAFIGPSGEATTPVTEQTPVNAAKDQARPPKVTSKKGPVPTAAPTAPQKPKAPVMLPKSAPPVVAKKPGTRGPSGDCLKGVGTWDLAGQSAMKASGSCWYYTWSPKDWFKAPPGVQFVPMIWSGKDMGDLDAVQGDTLLAFNEPDLSGQANMSVEQALDLWPRLQAKNMRLGSPAPAWGGHLPGGWLDRFMKGADARGHRVDFITVHWYGENFDTGTAVRELREYLQNVHARYRKPIWLTEFALIDHSNGMRFASEEQNAAFVREATDMLETLPYLERYAYFGLPNTKGFATGLYRADSSPTPAGLEFQKANRTK